MCTGQAFTLARIRAGRAKPAPVRIRWRKECLRIEAPWTSAMQGGFNGSTQQIR